VKAAGEFSGTPKVLKKVIADARGWDRDPELYAKVRDRLVTDLKAD